MQQEDISDHWMYKYPDDDPTGAAWHRARIYPQHTESIPWAALIKEAEHAYHWVSNQPGAWTKGGPTKNGACLVSALFVPRPDGGCIFFSTIGRGKRANEIMVLKNPREWAPAWLAANDGRPNAVHCEDGSCYDFEKYNSCLDDKNQNKVKMAPNGKYTLYLPRKKTGRQLYVQIAIFGALDGATGYVGLQTPCEDGNPTKHPKVPRCQNVLRRLGVRWCTEELARIEREEAKKAAGVSGGTAGGGSGGTGTGNGGAGGGATGGGSGAGTGSGTGHGFQGPQGGSNAAYFSKAGGKSQAHSTTGHNYGGSYTSNLSHDIADYMSGLSIGTGKLSASAPKQAGLPKGQSSSNDVFTAFENIGEGEVDTNGHPVYYGIVFDKKPKGTAQRVSVNIYGMAFGQFQYFCFDSKGTPFVEPPGVSEKDPNPERAEKLYRLAEKLCSGKMAAAPIPHDHYKAPQTYHDHPIQSGHAAYGHDGGPYSSYGHNTNYRPSTASSGGSGGEYTTRPGSRDGTTGSTGYTSVPRTAAYGQHPGDYYGAPGSRPSSRNSAGQSQLPVSKSGSAGGGPSKPPAASNLSAAQKNPPPPSKVKLDVPKSKKPFTVHGISKGKPYIKGVDGERDNQHYEVSYSDKNNRFYISKGQSRKDRVYLIEI